MTRSQVQPIGIDFGSDSIKLLQLEVVDRSALAVLAAARRDVPAEARGDTLEVDQRVPVAVELVRQMMRQHAFQGRSIVASLPREFVHVKNLRLPKIPPAELEAAVFFESRNVFDFEVDQAHVQFLHAGEVRQGNDTRQEVLVLAARHDDVNGFVEQLHRGGLVVESLDFEPSAIYRSVERFIRRREDEQEVFVLVDVGLRATQVIIGRGRDMSFLKTIDLAGRHFNEAVSRKLEITPDEARELRRRMIQDAGPDDPAVTQREALGGGDPVRQAVFDATRSLMDELSREISLCLRYHSVTFRGHRPGKLRLTGGEACDPQLQAILSATLPIPIEPARPLLSVDCARMQQTDCRGRLSEWAVAFGLGLKLTRSYFGARDGRQRLDGAPAGAGSPGSGAELADLTAGAIAAASPPRPPSSSVSQRSEEAVHA